MVQVFNVINNLWNFILTNPSASATILATCIAGVIAYKFQRSNLLMMREKMEKDLFKEFNERYDNLNDKLSDLNEDLDFQALKKEYNESLKSAIIDYFNLCAEQYYWYKKGRISPKIWNSWHSGMMYYYNTYPVIKELWKIETESDKYKSYYLDQNVGFFEK